VSALRALRLLRASTRVLRNWPSAWARYLAAKVGLAKSVTVKCGGEEYALEPRAFSLLVRLPLCGAFTPVCKNGVVGRLWGAVDVVYARGA